MKVEYPTENQIKQSISEICEKGIRRPDGVFSFLKKMTNNIGIEKIFYGIYDVFLISLLIMASVYSVILYLIDVFPNIENIVYLSTFFTSPLLFSILFFLTYIKEKSSNTFMVKMSCKYTFFHLLAYRMFVFSLLSMVSNTVYVFFLAIKLDYSFVTVLSISLSALFVFSTSLVVLMLKFSSIKTPFLFSMFWCVFNISLILYPSNFFENILKAIPLMIWIIVAIINVIIYLKMLPKVALERKSTYAYN